MGGERKEKCGRGRKGGEMWKIEKRRNVEERKGRDIWKKGKGKNVEEEEREENVEESLKGM